jgi:hypothetical protein
MRLTTSWLLHCLNCCSVGGKTNGKGVSIPPYTALFRPVMFTEPTQLHERLSARILHLSTLRVSPSRECGLGRSPVCAQQPGSAHAIRPPGHKVQAFLSRRPFQIAPFPLADFQSHAAPMYVSSVRGTPDSANGVCSLLSWQ